MSGQWRRDSIDILDDIEEPSMDDGNSFPDPQSQLKMMSLQCRMMIEAVHFLGRLVNEQERESDNIKELVEVVSQNIECDGEVEH